MKYVMYQISVAIYLCMGSLFIEVLLPERTLANFTALTNLEIENVHVGIEL